MDQEDPRTKTEPTNDALDGRHCIFISFWHNRQLLLVGCRHIKHETTADRMQACEPLYWEGTCPDCRELVQLWKQPSGRYRTRLHEAPCRYERNPEQLHAAWTKAEP